MVFKDEQFFEKVGYLEYNLARQYLSRKYHISTCHFYFKNSGRKINKDLTALLD